ncbi:hypothetical protein MNQ98_16430 [Paenibacillus sp. N3/727]|uniref:hypothetical protein n=1 Tax=Paenibacillus sp. N3/727 TaxID=2925845 RepID=UPI001F5322C4|nr:hypothetical protein [Paenibacillus sp. N3/727]UNK16122.1 hypothetical protein MNQ98_16430 [Paenibacillus sp. N3/727]
MEQVNQHYVMEMVLFRLKEGTDKNSFCQAAAALTEVLQTEFSGFKTRTLLHTPDETQWTDIIYWSDMEMALTAMNQLKSVPAFQTFVSMIDSREIMLQHLIPANLSM